MQTVFKGQALHLISLMLLLAGVIALADGSVLTGQFLGISTVSWLIVAIAVPIAHQVYVWFVWRAELHHAWISHWFGKKSFYYYAVGFSILLISRLLSIVALAFANRNTLPLDPTLSTGLALAISLPALYLLWSVYRYFGFQRAFGIDHFDPRYRAEPLVKEGIFRFSDNGMYVFGFLVLWIPGLLWLSQAALLAALFNHLYIWVHYYATERPDIDFIYGPAVKGRSHGSTGKTSQHEN